MKHLFYFYLGQHFSSNFPIEKNEKKRRKKQSQKKKRKTPKLLFWYIKEKMKHSV